MGSTIDRIARLINAERAAQHTAKTNNGCTLGDARTCDATGARQNCAGCGWRIDEIRRRRRLPLHRNHIGLWQKRVGIRKESDDAYA